MGEPTQNLRFPYFAGGFHSHRPEIRGHAASLSHLGINNICCLRWLFSTPSLLMPCDVLPFGSPGKYFCNWSLCRLQFATTKTTTSRPTRQFGVCNRNRAAITVAKIPILSSPDFRWLRRQSCALFSSSLGTLCMALLKLAATPTLYT